MALDPLLPRGGEKRAHVREMFDRIAPRYDALNRLMTLGLDQRWRRQTLERVGVGPGDRLLDLACGTGDLAAQAAARGARVVGIDFAGEMLRRGRRRGLDATLAQGDAAQLPLATGSVTAVVSGFALRNFVSLPEVFAEMARVLAPGGRLALLDVDRPTAGWVRAAHSLYFDRVVPRVGGWLSDRDAYRYLPQSTVYLPSARRMREMLVAVGFERIERCTPMLGAVQIVTAVREG